MTADGSIEDAVTAHQTGPRSTFFLCGKPVISDYLLLLVSRALEQRRLVTENLLYEELAVRRGAPQLVGDDSSLRKVFASRHGRPRPTRPCSSKARAEPARSSSRARCMCQPASEAPLIQPRGHPADAARDRALRSRERRLYGCGLLRKPGESKWRTGERCSSMRFGIRRCSFRPRSCARSASAVRESRRKLRATVDAAAGGGYQSRAEGRSRAPFPGLS